MKDGRVSLPSTVAVDSFIKEMEHYNLEYDKENIKSETNENLEKSDLDSLKETLESMRKEEEEAHLVYHSRALARVLYENFIISLAKNHVDESSENSNSLNDEKCFKFTLKMCGHEDNLQHQEIQEEKFIKFIEKHGVVAIKAMMNSILKPRFIEVTSIVELSSSMAKKCNPPFGFSAGKEEANHSMSSQHSNTSTESLSSPVTNKAETAIPEKSKATTLFGSKKSETPTDSSNAYTGRRKMKASRSFAATPPSSSGTSFSFGSSNPFANVNFAPSIGSTTKSKGFTFSSSKPISFDFGSKSGKSAAKESETNESEAKLSKDVSLKSSDQKIEQPSRSTATKLDSPPSSTAYPPLSVKAPTPLCTFVAPFTPLEAAPVASNTAPFGFSFSSSVSSSNTGGSSNVLAPSPSGFNFDKSAGTKLTSFQPTRKQDGTSSIQFQSITAMPQYQNKSFEELRVEDYLADSKSTLGQVHRAANANVIKGCFNIKKDSASMTTSSIESRGLSETQSKVSTDNKEEEATSTFIFGVPKESICKNKASSSYTSFRQKVTNAPFSFAPTKASPNSKSPHTKWSSLSAKTCTNFSASQSITASPGSKFVFGSSKPFSSANKYSEQGGFQFQIKSENSKTQNKVEKMGMQSKEQQLLEHESEIAKSKQKEGKYYEAEPLFRKCHLLSEGILGPNHPNTLSLMSDLASVLEKKDEYSKAESLFSDCLARREASLGPVHQDTLLSMRNLANIYRLQKKYDKAENLYDLCLPKVKSILAYDHQTLLAMYGRSVVYFEKGEKAKAEAELSDCVSKSEKTLGVDHPHTIEFKYVLAIIHLENGEIEKSRPLLLRVFAKRTATLGSEHPDTIETFSRLADLYSKQVKYALQNLYSKTAFQ